MNWTFSNYIPNHYCPVGFYYLTVLSIIGTVFFAMHIGRTVDFLRSCVCNDNELRAIATLKFRRYVYGLLCCVVWWVTFFTYHVGKIILS